MKILNAEQTRKLDAYTIASQPILSVNLMEQAARACADWLLLKFKNRYLFTVVAGPGNNGGDALAIARLLAKAGKKVRVFVLTDKLSADSQVNFERLQKMGLRVHSLAEMSQFPPIDDSEIVVEGLFGSGLTRTIAGRAADVVAWLNEAGATVVSVDVPSGLMDENNAGLAAMSEKEQRRSVVFADYTLALEMPFLSFFMAENERFVGEWHTVGIGLDLSFIPKLNPVYELIGDDFLHKIYRKRSRYGHKGTYGHVLLIGGSRGKMGALQLAARAALKAGSGLVHAHIPADALVILQTALPEIMVSCDDHAEVITGIPDLEPYSAVGMGVGLGQYKRSAAALERLLESCQLPLVLDADALNLLGANRDLLQKLPKNSILTPHPKEFDRMTVAHTTGFERLQTQREFSAKYGVICVLKGAHTCISTPDGQVFINNSGNPGMATAGSGDVLTGVLTSLCGQGYSLQEAAILGVFLHGRAGDLALDNESYESLTAGGIIDRLGAAFKSIGRMSYEL